MSSIEDPEELCMSSISAFVELCMSRNCNAGRQADRQAGRPNRVISEARPGQTRVDEKKVAESYVPRARRRARRYETTFVRD